MTSRKTITRTALVERWGLSPKTIVNREREGILTPIKGNARTDPVRYSLTEVELAERFKLHESKQRGRGNKKAKSHQEGEIVAQAFRMFRQGATLADVVIELDLKPQTVDDLYEQYKDGDLEDRYMQRKMDEWQ